MATQRTADLIIGAFKDEMTTRRKYVLETPNGTNIDLYFPPITSKVKLRTLLRRPIIYIILFFQI